MKKLLITGFDPFGGEKVNPSWEAVKSLPDVVGDFRLHKLQLPTVFGRGAQQLIEEAETFRPDVILCIGQDISQLLKLAITYTASALGAHTRNTNLFPSTR